KALVILPDYKAAGQTTRKAGEMVISPSSRHGAITGVYSNQDYFSFGINVHDQAVLKVASGGSLGAPRKFSIVGYDGQWHPGWRYVQFVPDAKEQEFIDKFGLAKNGEVVFQNFVHPNRWASVFGGYYLLSKVMIDRLIEERGELKTKL